MQEEIEFVIAENIDELVTALNKEGVDITARDIHYSFLGREEYVYMRSERFYNGEQIPAKFGVYRGYAGGGVHSALQPTEFKYLSERRKPKAQRLLNLFEKCFNDTLSEIDSIQEEYTGEEPEPWESAKL